MYQEFYTLFCQSLIFQKNFMIIKKLLVFVTPLKISLFSEKREKKKQERLRVDRLRLNDSMTRKTFIARPP